MMIQGVAAAWAMTQLTQANDLVALVQTAQSAPIMLFALAAGAMADIYDCRLVSLVALAMALVGSASLTALGFLGVLTPPLLLAFCFLLGSATALLLPAWQASVGELVPRESLPAAVALNSICYNLARSIGPAIGGLVIAAAGAPAAFALNTVLYAPLLIVVLFWRRVREPVSFPPETLARAVVSGVRYVAHAPAIRTVLARSLLTGAASATLMALLPLVAREQLHGSAQTFGLLLGAFGGGAVIGALSVGDIRNRLPSEMALRICCLIMCAATAVIGVSASPAVTMLALVVGGAAWMITFSLFGVSVQLAAPRWVVARAVASSQACMAGGIAIGAWIWGAAAESWGVEGACLLSAGSLLLLPVVCLWLRMPEADKGHHQLVEAPGAPDFGPESPGQSGAVQVEYEYRIASTHAAEFHRLMRDVRLARIRNGARRWSLSRDVGDPEIWIEKYSCPSWLDYLRFRGRTTRAENDIQARIRDLQRAGEPVKERHRLRSPLTFQQETRAAADAAHRPPAPDSPNNDVSETAGS
jgi:predicted MFS family arabinose efflux permease